MTTNCRARTTRTTLLAALLAAAALTSAGCGDPYATESASRKVDRNAANVAATTDRVTAKAAVAIDAAAITTQVKTAVLAEPGLRSLLIDVDTKNGVVTLTGTVNSASLKERATSIAQNVNGVRSVIDNLAVKSTG